MLLHVEDGSQQRCACCKSLSSVKVPLLRCSRCKLVLLCGKALISLVNGRQLRYQSSVGTECQTAYWRVSGHKSLCKVVASNRLFFSTECRLVPEKCYELKLLQTLSALTSPSGSPMMLTASVFHTLLPKVYSGLRTQVLAPQDYHVTADSLTALMTSLVSQGRADVMEPLFYSFTCTVLPYNESAQPLFADAAIRVLTSLRSVDERWPAWIPDVRCMVAYLDRLLDDWDQEKKQAADPKHSPQQNHTFLYSRIMAATADLSQFVLDATIPESRMRLTTSQGMYPAQPLVRLVAQLTFVR
jgi:hypothetical protein